MPPTVGGKYFQEVEQPMEKQASIEHLWCVHSHKNIHASPVGNRLCTHVCKHIPYMHRCVTEAKVAEDHR